MLRSLPIIDKRNEDPTNVDSEELLTVETASANIDEDTTEHSHFGFKEDPTFTDRVPGKDIKAVSSDEPSASEDEENAELSIVSSFKSELDIDTSLETLNKDDGDETDIKDDPSIMGSESTDKDEDNTEHSSLKSKEDPTRTDIVPEEDSKPVSSDAPSAREDEETAELPIVSSFKAELFIEDDGDAKDIKEDPSIIGSESTDKDEDNTEHSSIKSKEDPTCTDRVPGEDTKPVSSDETSASQDEEPAALSILSSFISNLKLKGSFLSTLTR